LLLRSAHCCAAAASPLPHARTAQAGPRWPPTPALAALGRATTRLHPAALATAGPLPLLRAAPARLPARPRGAPRSACLPLPRQLPPAGPRARCRAGPRPRWHCWAALPLLGHKLRFGFLDFQ